MDTDGHGWTRMPEKNFAAIRKNPRYLREDPHPNGAGICWLLG